MQVKARPIVEELFLYAIIAAFFACIAAGSITHRHGGHCGHASQAEAKTP